MITKQQQKTMQDYLVAKLAGSSESIEPRSKEILPGITTNYILVNPDGVVLLIDKVYSGSSFEELHRRVFKQRQNIGIAIYKDSETFFRSAARKKRFKKDNGLSLKNYSNEELYRMILFRPEEFFIFSRSKFIQYYQPTSSRLTEEIVSYQFTRVRFDYSHISYYDRFQPQNTDSKKLFIWNSRMETKNPLVLKDSNLEERI